MSMYLLSVIALAALIAIIVIAAIALGIVLIVRSRQRKRDDLRRAGEYGSADPNDAARRAEGGDNAWMRTTF